MKLWQLACTTQRSTRSKNKPATLPYPTHHHPFLRKQSPLTPLSSTYRKPSTQPKLSLAAAQPRHLHDDLSAVTSTSKQTSPSQWAEVTTLSSSTSTFKVPKPAVCLTPNRNHSRACMRPAEFSACQSPGWKTGHRIGLSSCALAPPSCCLQAMPYSAPPPSAHGGATCMLKRATLLFHPSAPQDRHRQMMHHTTIDRPKPSSPPCLPKSLEMSQSSISPR
jgi:hypothetical protein